MGTVEGIAKDAIEIIVKATNNNEIKGVIQNIATLFGFELFTYARLFPKAMTRLEMVVIGNYPDEFVNVYMENEYYYIDPAMKHCTSSGLPYYWKEIFTCKEQNVIDFSENSSRFGLKEGFTVGVNGNFGDYSVFSLGGSKPTDELSMELEKAVGVAHMIMPYIHEQVSKISPVKPIFPTLTKQYSDSPLQELTTREKECLLWTADGKTSHEISVILSISESTVNFHLKNSVKKLDCINKTHAVAKAVLLGLIKNMTEY